jgi:hypothetical protein
MIVEFRPAHAVIHIFKPFSDQLMTSRQTVKALSKILSATLAGVHFSEQWAMQFGYVEDRHPTLRPTVRSLFSVCTDMSKARYSRCDLAKLLMAKLHEIAGPPPFTPKLLNSGPH